MSDYQNRYDIKCDILKTSIRYFNIRTIFETESTAVGKTKFQVTNLILAAFETALTAFHWRLMPHILPEPLCKLLTMMKNAQNQIFHILRFVPQFPASVFHRFQSSCIDFFFIMILRCVGMSTFSIAKRIIRYGIVSILSTAYRIVSFSVENFDLSTQYIEFTDVQTHH